MAGDQGPGRPQATFYTRDAAKKLNHIDIPHVELPKGGGAIKGIDEKFSVNAANGTATLELPLPMTAGRATPALALRYDSGNGNSIFGLGWSLDVPMISRRLDRKLPRYLDREDSDTFLLSGTDDLMPALRPDQTRWQTSVEGCDVLRFRPRVEGSFALIERVWPDGEDAFYWKVTSPTNSVTFYGLTAATRVADPEDPRKIVRWLPELAFDNKGNIVAYEYKVEDGAPGSSQLHDRNRYTDQAKPKFTNLYLKRVRYGNRVPWFPSTTYRPTAVDVSNCSYEAVLDFGEHGDPIVGDATAATVPYEEQRPWPARTDPHSDYRTGFEIRTMRLCRRILMFHHFAELGTTPCLVRSLDVEYVASQPGSAPLAEVTYLASARLRGYRRSADGDVYSVLALPPQTFSYQPLTWHSAITVVDADTLPVGLTEPYQWVDLWNQGLAGVLTEQENTLYYNENRGSGLFSGARAVARRPSSGGLANSTIGLQDLDADGSKQLVVRGQDLNGYYELDGRESWRSFTPFAQTVTFDMAAPNVLHIDLDGDGRPDLLVTEDSAVRWYPSLGREGYGPPDVTVRDRDEERGPVLVWNDPVQRIFLADLSGDGLADLVRIRNGEVCYWPNLGYGRFGDKVAMDDAPRFARDDEFDPRYLHLADLSGTGASDLLYVAGTSAYAWLNLSGNGWSPPVEITLPVTVNSDRIAIVDFLGDGTPCLVWSSPRPSEAVAPLRYIDLLGGKKPHLLIGFDNGIGLQTTLAYRCSTRYFLDDAAAGTPWKTTLPFAVQCLARVEVRDTVTATLAVGEYTYHHGYYDHAEREFRGFGRVDQRDTETFARWVHEDASNIVDEQFHQPVVFTRTWFHHGAPPDGGDALGLFVDDFWFRNQDLIELSGGMLAPEVQLPPAGLPAALTPEELREAYRACKGMTLRREVFALDAPAQGATDAERRTQLLPFVVELHNCAVRRVQPHVFVVYEQEALTIAYERMPDDARITHTLHLDVDAYARPQASVSVVYGRQLAAQPPGLADDVWAAQRSEHLTLTERHYTVDELTAGASPYFLPAECEVRAYELTGASHAPVGALHALSELQQLAAAATEIGFEAQADDQPHKRLAECSRVLYCADDLASPQPFGRASSVGLVRASYQLAMTDAVLRSAIPASKLADAEIQAAIADACGYVHFDDLHGATDPGWWVSSGTVDYLDPARAAQRFYQAAGFTDARGATTTVRYLGEDATRTNASTHWGMIESMTDAVGNVTTTSEFDFTCLAPRHLVDINGNHSEVAIDELGRVIATAVMGKGDQADDFALLETRLLDRVGQTQNAEQFLSTADSGAATWLLGDATTRWIYDDSQLPVRVASIGRERHVRDLAKTGDPLRLQVAFEYLTGHASPLVKKIAVPGNRWLANGRTVVNNKGSAVKQFEPYFSPTHLFDPEQQLVDTGVSPVLTYDSLNRHVRTDHPDGTLDYTTFDAWSQAFYDQNDAVLASSWYQTRIALAADNPQRIAAEQAALHADTPLTIHLDALGRQFYSIAHVRARLEDGTIEEAFPTLRANLDIEGNVRAAVDARGNVVLARTFDMLGRSLYQATTDFGERWNLIDVGGAILYQWDSRGQRIRNVLDAMHRPIEEWRRTGNAAETLWRVTEWGEQAQDASVHNLRGQVSRVFDSAGLFESIDFDFAGRRLETHRRYLAGYQEDVAWPVTNREALLEQETFRTRSTYDALGRPMSLFSPDTPQIPATQIMLGYDVAGRMARVDAHVRGAAATTTVVDDIAYNEKGQRLAIKYGNGVVTSYTYDTLTFRLVELTTQRADSRVLQDLHYTYDPVGNVILQTDAAQQTTYFAGAVTTGGGTFEYDSLYRLTRATGREQIAQNAPTSEWDRERSGAILPGDAQAMQPYREWYEYDVVGNLLALTHDASSGGQFTNRWTRSYAYASDSNRLLSTTVGGTTVPYSYNEHGSMSTMPHLQVMDWDPMERLGHIRQGTTDAYYAYDEHGRRARKVVEKQGGVREVRLYLGELEIFRRYRNNVLELVRETQHFMDDSRRIALAETRTLGSDDAPAQALRYQLANQLHSAVVELDEIGDVITYEEYHPFGTTSWQAGRSVAEVSLKRYRYSGQERDDESGLNYHGARYYASWLGRWISTDPGGLVDGPNVYTYASNNPVVLHDPNGMQTGKPSDTDHVIMQMTDPELHKFLSNMDPPLQKAFMAGATGAFAQRAAKMVARYNLESVKITSKTRRIGDVAKYSDQGRANYLDMFGSRRRADEAEHLLATAAVKWLANATDKWKRDSPTIVLAEAHSRLKTPTDNQLTRDLKAGKITSEEWLAAAKTNAYESWFEARAQGIAVPSADEFVAAILQQETAMLVNLYNAQQADAARRQQFIQNQQGQVIQNLTVRPDATVGSQALLQQRVLTGGAVTASVVGTVVVGGFVILTVETGGGDIPVIVAVAEGTGGTVAAAAGTEVAVADVVATGSTGLRFAVVAEDVATVGQAAEDVEAARDLEALRELQAEEEAAEALKAAQQAKQLLP